MAANDSNLSNPPSSSSFKEDLKARMSSMDPSSPNENKKGPSSNTSGAGGASQSLKGRPPRLEDMAAAARQLSTLLDAGIALLPALRIMAQRGQHPLLRSVFERVRTRVEQGQTLHAALAEHPRVFSPLFLGVVKIGETGGILDRSLRRLAEIFEQRLSIRRQILSALAYPAVAITLAIIVLGLIMGIAIPKFAEIYAAQKVPLPGLTRVILGFSEFVRHWPLIYIPVILVIGFLAWNWARSEGGRSMMDMIRLRLWPIGPVNRNIQTARVTRTLGNLLEAGIPLLETLRLTAETSENVHVREALLRVRAGVEKGEKLEPPLRAANIFPPLAVDMIAIGDEAGRLDFMLEKIAVNYEDQVESALRGITSIIEPVLIILLGIIVFLIALGALLPYFKLVGAVGASDV